MPTTLPLDVYEAPEEELGKERARKLVHALETAVDAAVESKWLHVQDELTERLVTKEEFRMGLEHLRVELNARIDRVYAELNARIEQTAATLDAKIDRLNMKLNFVLLLLILIAMLWNPAVADLLRKWLGLG